MTDPKAKQGDAGRQGPLTPNPDLAKQTGAKSGKTVKGTTTPTKRG